MEDSSSKIKERYSRQALFWGVGHEGQRKLCESSVAVIGCGALGCAIINLLARAGVGKLTVVDRDFVELSNLQRQLLFEEADATAGLPKAIAAAQAVQRINSEVQVRPLVADVSPINIESIIAGADVVLDGTDNLETRYLVNDACVKRGIPWVYGGALESSGMSMTILPKETACLRCLFPKPPTAGTIPTCETAGVIASSPAVVASIQVTETLKIIVGDREHINRGMIFVDIWSHDYNKISQVIRNHDCPCCGQGRYDYLEAKATSRTTSLCGRNAVQVTPSSSRQLNLREVGKKLEVAGMVRASDYVVRFFLESYELAIFADGRAIIKGTNDEAMARSLYARYVGT